MFSPLERIKVDSIYGGDLPKRMAKCTPDMLFAIRGMTADLQALNTRFVLSDLYRSYDMQLQAHLDYVTGKKDAYSPPPGGSMHEAGRAFDMDLEELKHISLADFWEVAAKYGVTPIIDTPTSGKSESWHFDRRGSHDLVYRYYRSGKGDNFGSPYRAMAASAIVSTGQKVDDLGKDPLPGYIQSGLIRLGKEIGDMDGRVGPKTRGGLSALGIDPSADLVDIGAAIDERLQDAFPEEFFIQGENAISAMNDGLPLYLADTFSGLAAGRPPYLPGHLNKGKLGKIVGLLEKAEVIDKNFALQPRFIATLPGGQLYFDSELQLDTDGWPDGKGKGDAHWQPETSLRYNDGAVSINSNTVAYMVLPHSAKWVSDLGISLGDYAAVLNKGVLTFAVFADGGPNNKIGEGSLQLLRKLGHERIKPNGRVLNAGTGPGIVTIVFPGSGAPVDRADETTLQEAIKSRGRVLFEALAQ